MNLIKAAAIAVVVKDVFVAIVLVMLASRVSQAHTGSCGDLKMYDERQFCWAVQQNEPARCDLISNDTMRSRCKAAFR